MSLSQLAFLGGNESIPDKKGKFIWPRITKQIEFEVIDQLNTTISIYDRSSVFEEFESKFAKYHNAKYGLLSNSGTSSILGMFDAIGLSPGDEIICPVYTFHATISPAMSTGAIPVFCDCDEQGNISIEEIKRKLSKKTKAVIVTHMWGMPVKNIQNIANLCSEQHIWLLEDCSHAHGAQINGRKVGSFGDAAAWSLQGEKVISGGEGGIMLTNNETLYNKALIHGHYNKRPKQEICKNSHLYPYNLTGKGLKLRAHPLAIRIALNQFDQLDHFIKIKNKHALLLDSVIDKYAFLNRINTYTAQSSWYAYGFHFNPSLTFGITREEFVSLLHAEGLIEIDIPGSTNLINSLPLFIEPNKVYPSLYDKPLSKQIDFPNATKFTEHFIKMPVWAFEEDIEIVEGYIQGLEKVCSMIEKHKTNLKKRLI